MNQRSIVSLVAMADPVSMLSDPVDESVPSEPSGAEGSSPDRPVLRDLLISFERNMIVTALFAADGDQKRAAAALGVLPTTFQEKLRRFGLIHPRPGQHARSGERRSGLDDPMGPPREAHEPPTGESPK